tara:strand:+ start:579 stop:908 length:330 start_codon:yes stop_codon:yes gene_type:complete
MRIYKYLVFLILIIFLVVPRQILSESETNIYIKDFYLKSDEASKILKEIESNLKEGSRKKVCSRQREAAKLGLLANKSLIKAFDTEGIKPPMDVINSNKKRWEFILNQC